MPEYIERCKCETCLYNKNCQFLATHRRVIVEGCTAYKNSADMVEVVRCKDCAFGKDDEFGMVLCFCRNAPWDNKYVDYFTMPPLAYCSYGKRKEGAEE